MDTITISGHEYGVDGASLIAERYDDGVELRISPVTNGLSVPLTASFIRRGPRGGTLTAYGALTVGQAEEVALRMMDARKHLRILDAYRQNRWGEGDGE